MDERAAELGFERRVVPGVEVPLVTFARSTAALDPERLHVYLGGDGSPRRAARWSPPDPTPAEALALQLMVQDERPSLYLGRPCYHAVSPCNPWYWTIGRYSKAVVDAMAEGLRVLMWERDNPELVLIGFSGGGALAMLLAERFREVRAVISVAGNLDVSAWTEHHDFARLTDSLDPALRPPLRDEVLQLHLRGARDRAVPPALTEAAIARQPRAKSRVYADFDHHCCWEEAWPEVLAEVEAALAGR
jgi:pimeloyl-ACP methyl ester carboxylesterase